MKNRPHQTGRFFYVSLIFRLLTNSLSNLLRKEQQMLATSHSLNDTFGKLKAVAVEVKLGLNYSIPIPIAEAEHAQSAGEHHTR